MNLLYLLPAVFISGLFVALYSWWALSQRLIKRLSDEVDLSMSLERSNHWLEGELRARPPALNRLLEQLPQPDRETMWRRHEMKKRSCRDLYSLEELSATPQEVFRVSEEHVTLHLEQFVKYVDQCVHRRYEHSRRGVAFSMFGWRVGDWFLTPYSGVES